MCDRYLHCPYCSRRLVALCSIAGDNATGFYVEFFLVKPTGTEAHGFVPAQTDAIDASSGEAIVVGKASHLEVDLAVAGVPYAEERGFDDDEAPFPTKVR